MGLSTTATHVIWFIAITTAGALAVDSYFDGATAVDAARRARDARAELRLDASLSDARFCWDGDKLRVMASNVGRATLDTANVSFVVDGLVLTGFVANVETHVDTGSWPPGFNATFNRTGVAAEPARVVLFASEGISAYAVKTTCPVLTSVVVTPSSASMDIGEARAFEATGYDQFGNLYGTSAFQWSSGCGDATATSATHATFTAGTVAGACTLTATADGVSGTASIVIDPDAPSSIVVSPDPAGIPAGGTRAFTATVRDQYGNVNATSPVSWSTTAGSIGSDGVLTAQTTAATGLGVTALTDGGLSDSATVDVYAAAVDRIVVAPASATLLLNATQQFTATAYDQYDNANASVTFVWSATSGSVSGAGLYTAPSTGGTATVTASAEGKSGSATVTLQRETHVDAMATYKNGQAAASFRKGVDTVEVRTTVRDHEGALVAGGASVTIEFVDEDGIVRHTASGTTDATGVASASYALPQNAKLGAWTARVSAMSGTHLAYNSAANVVTSVGFTVTAN